MAKEGKLLKHTVLIGASSALCKAVSFFLLPLYTATLSPAEFGASDILVSTAVLLLPLVSCNAPEAVFRFGAGEHAPSGVLAAGARCVGIGLFVFLLFLPLFGFSQVLRPYLLYLYLYVAAANLHSLLAHALRAAGEYGLYALQQIFCALLTAVLGVLFLTVLRLGVRGYLASVLVADLITAIVLALCLRPWRLLQGNESRQGLARAMLRYSVPLIPASALWWVIALSDRYILLSFHGEVATGIYAAAGRLPSLLTFALGIFMEAWQYAAICEKNETRAVRFGKMYAMLLPFLVALCAALMLAARPLVWLIFDADYAAAARDVPLLLLAGFFAALASFFGSVYTVKMHSGAVFWTTLGGALLNLVLNFALIPRMGTTGAALATCFAYALVFVLRAWHTRATMPFYRYAKKTAASALLLLFAALLGARARLGPFAIGALLAPIPFWREGINLLAFLRKRLDGVLKKRKKARGDIDKA
ncbi:MAG: oligosaccharide flippase family protein [Clostridia bacterium]|nr:oligosaccharide flippase family protein [Clostridia bacterium]